MGVYTDNIFNLSLTDLVRNIENIESKVADDEKKIKRYEKRNKDPRKSKTCVRRRRSGKTSSTQTFQR